MCKPCEQAEKARQQANQTITRAAGINQQLAQKAYAERMNTILQNKIHQQQVNSRQITYR